MGRRRERDKGLVALAVLALLLGGGAVWVIVQVLSDDSLPTFGPSMRPTITTPSAIEIDEDAYADATPERGDIVTAQAPKGVEDEACAVRPSSYAPCAEPTSDYSPLRVVKRVVAVPGDRVAFNSSGHLILDGKPQREPYIRECMGECALPETIEIPAGLYFLAGDNRPVSSDSRIWGPLPLEAIDGRVRLPAD